MNLLGRSDKGQFCVYGRRLMQCLFFSSVDGDADAHEEYAYTGEAEIDPTDDG